jgi:hypothetical protein
VAAPGCNVSSYTIGGTEVQYSGTSQAAALTSFALALLKRELMAAYRPIHPQAWWDKIYLTRTADLSAPLQSYVSFGAALNIPRLLAATRYDTITLKPDGVNPLAMRLQLGTIGRLSALPTGFDGIAGCVREGETQTSGGISLRRIAKIVPHYASGPLPMRVLVQTSDKDPTMLVAADCPATSQTLQFTGLGGAASAPLALDALQDVTFCVAISTRGICPGQTIRRL